MFLCVTQCVLWWNLNRKRWIYCQIIQWWYFGILNTKNMTDSRRRTVEAAPYKRSLVSLQQELFNSNCLTWVFKVWDLNLFVLKILFFWVCIWSTFKLNYLLIHLNSNYIFAALNNWKHIRLSVKLSKWKLHCSPAITCTNKCVLSLVRVKIPV